MLKRISIKIIPVLIVIMVLTSSLILRLPLPEARAQQAAPEITVSCRVEPEKVLVGKTGMLYVSIEDVPAETQPGYGMNAYEIHVTWTANGAIAFLESSPRPGPDPWDTDSTLVVPGLNKINNGLGTMQSVRLLNSSTPRFSGKSDLFLAPFSTNQTGTFTFSISKASIPYYALDSILYRVVIENCSVTVDEGSAIYLPLIQR
ncbi:MAG: hypothetical protein EHM41_18725 [Chloroflexi bacterium]|nr:MAG: hypothetical protein EHM41_18725 [Chloroflexota bacterium]